MKKRSVFAIIVAGGYGSRCPGLKTKQFLDLNGRPVFIWSVKAFQEAESVTGIIIVGPGNNNEALAEMGSLTKSFAKVIKIVGGGDSRTESVRNGVAELENIKDITAADPILIHDGVRPLITPHLIDLVAGNVNCNQAAIPTTTPTATVKKIVDNRIIRTINREETGLAQTPQGVPYGFLREALTCRAENPNPIITDEGSLLENLPRESQNRITMINVQGDPDNLKVTFPKDLQRAETILRKREEKPQTEPETHYKPRIATGFGYDVHAFKADRKLILGGIEIPHELGLDGHSDADVLVHALVDAILGAIGAGDIGQHFPDHDPAHKNRCSLDFLEQAMLIVEEKGFRLEAADITVVAERPKLNPYIPAMTHKLRGVMVQPCQLNIKATTSEGLGFTGRREGIAAYAIATVTAT